MHPKTYQWLVGVFASLGSVLYGYDLGVINGVISSTNFIDTFNPGPTLSGTVVALFTAGAFFGAAFAGETGDRLGRRSTILIGAVIFILGGGLQTGARSLVYLYSGRFFAGLGVGFLTMIVPLYQAEIAHPSIRGMVTSLQQFMLGIGSLVAGWLTWGCYTDLPETNSGQWRIPLGIQLVPAIFLAALILLFPESPRWLIDHNQAEEGLATLARLHANNNIADPFLQAQYAEIQESITHEHEHAAKSYVDLFRNKSSFHRLLIACSLQAACQMTGVSAIQYFCTIIYAQIGINTNDALKYQAINNILALLAECACMLTIDFFGRRKPLIISNFFNCLFFIIPTILLAVYGINTSGYESTKGSPGWGFIIMTWLYNISFSYACGPLSWIIPAEIFDTYTRSKGVAIATMVAFAFNTMIGQVTDPAMTNVGWKYYLLFDICNFTNAAFFYFFLPETKKLPLEEMNKFFEDAPWVVAGTKYATFRPEVVELDRRFEEVKEKGGVVEHEDEPRGEAEPA